MKNKLKIFLALVIGAFTAFSCNEKDETPLGTAISANESSISFDGTNAAAATLSIISDGDWLAVAPEWITVTPNYGSGNQTVQVKVADNLDTDGTLAAERKDAITFCVGGKEFSVDVIQAGDPNKKPAEIKKITVAEFNAAEENSSVFYELTGSISGIASAYYGNFYLTDETGTVYVYGLYDKLGGEYGAFEKLELSEGDIITMRGYRGSYNGLIEVMGGYYVSHVASLVSATPTEVEIEKEGGSFDVALAYKGETFEININQEAREWLNMGTIFPDGDTTRIHFTVLPNAGSPREATISFTSSKGSTVSTVSTKVKQDGSIIDMTIADFLAKEESEVALYRLTGKVKSIANDTYGNFYLEDATGEVYVYGLTATQVDKNDKSFGSLGIKVGDILTLVGTRASYSGTAQVGGPAYYVSHKSHTEATVAQFLAASTGDAYYKLTGTIQNLKSDVYGNFDLVDETGSVYVYGLTKAPVEKNDKSFASLGLKEGDKVTLVGTRAEYKGDAQVGGPAYYLYHESGSSEEEEGGQEEEGDTNAINVTIGSGNQTWTEATHATYGAGFTTTTNGLTISYYQYGNNNAARTPDADHIRIYQGSALVITSTANKAIKKVTIEALSENYVGPITVGESTVNPTGTKLVWTGTTNSFEAVTTKQVRAKSISVVLAE